MTNGTSKRTGKDGHATIVLRLADLEEDNISFADCRSVPLAEEEILKYRLQPNDLLFIRVNGSKANVSRYDDEEYMRDSDIVINSTGTGTLGRVGIYQNTDNPEGIPIVPDSHVTVVRVSDNLDPTYVFYYLKSMQLALEKMGEGSTNQKELKPISLQQLRIPIPPNQEQKRIVSVVDTMLGKLELVETNLI